MHWNGLVKRFFLCVVIWDLWYFKVIFFSVGSFKLYINNTYIVRIKIFDFLGVWLFQVIICQ